MLATADSLQGSMRGVEGGVSRYRKIRAMLDRVDKAARVHAKSRKRFAVYRYLRAVFRCYCTLEKREWLWVLRSLPDREQGIPDDRKCHAIRAIIDATTTLGDTQMRSRWTRALEFAWHREVRPNELIWFLKRSDGVAGCARLAAKFLREASSRDEEDDDEDCEGPVFRYEREEWRRMRDLDRRR